MAGKKGFSLIEIIVVLVIVGILATIAIPSYNNFVQQGAAQATQNNLISIHTAEQNYYFSNSSYVNFASLTAVNTALSLNLSDDYFTYFGTSGAYLTVPNYRITATNISDPTFKLILLGGVGVANATLQPNSGTSGNPSCTYITHPTDCPG